MNEKTPRIDAVVKQLYGKIGSIHGASIFFFSPPTIQGFSAGSGFDFQLQDKGGHTSAEMYKVTT